MDVRKEAVAKGDGEAKVANAPLRALLNERNFDFGSYGDMLSEGALYCWTVLVVFDEPRPPILLDGMHRLVAAAIGRKRVRVYFVQLWKT